MTHPNSYGAHREVKDGRIIPVDTDMQCWPCVIGTCDRNHVKTAATSTEPMTAIERADRAIKALGGRQARQRKEARRGLV